MAILRPKPLLEDEVGSFLEARGLDLGPILSISALTNGVSARVYRVTSERRSVVVKQALNELLVSALWEADPRRGATEASALRLARSFDPGSVPEVLDLDSERCTIVLDAAPEKWTDWRSVLLSTNDWSGARRVARFLGEFLGGLHARTWASTTVAAEFNDYDSFESLRIAPYYRSIQSLHPDRAGVIGACIDEVESTRECLVHGDFSPKNVLTSPDSSQSWVLDFEVANFGASVFDVAFLGHHLVMKALTRPEVGQEFLRLLSIFLENYRLHLGREASLERLGHQTAALLLARIDGVSRVDYMSSEQRDASRALALDALGSDDPSIAVVTDLVASRTTPERKDS